MERRHQDPIAPIRSPTLAGVFLIDKDFFYEIGAFDDGMQIWGFENIEISLRVSGNFVGTTDSEILPFACPFPRYIIRQEQIWQCGGRYEIIPCSHIGHVFRNKSPYTFPGGVAKNVLHNAARVAEVGPSFFESKNGNAFYERLRGHSLSANSFLGGVGLRMG